MANEVHADGRQALDGEGDCTRGSVPKARVSTCGHAVYVERIHAVHYQVAGDDDQLAGLRLCGLDVSVAPPHSLGDADGQGRQGRRAGQLLPDSVAASTRMDA